MRLIYFLILKMRVLALFILMERSLTWHCQRRFLSVFTPRYLTLSVGYSHSPHNLIFKLPSNFICLDLKITISVFFTLNEILFAISQLTRRFKSAFIRLFSFLIELLIHNKLVSSAMWGTLQNFISWFKSFIYKKIAVVLEQILERHHNL